MPSWVSSVPAEFGSAGSGKLKADQWRTLGTVHLPVAMAVLWSASDDRHKQLLDITFSLLSAIIVACSHVTSRKHAETYTRYMRSYVEGIKRHFPRLKLRPNHHLALHLDEHILQYGPVHSWWTFPFERLIGIIQRIPNNGKQGMQINFCNILGSHKSWKVNLKRPSQNHTFVLRISGAYWQGPRTLMLSNTAERYFRNSWILNRKELL